MKTITTIGAFILMFNLNAQQFISGTIGFSTNGTEEAANISIDHYSRNEIMMTSMGYQSYLLGNHNLLVGAYYENEGVYFGPVAGVGIYKNSLGFNFGIRTGYFLSISNHISLSFSNQFIWSSEYDYEVDDPERINPRNQRSFNFFDFNVGIAYRIL
ncbi:MAG: hypothetical protein RJQ00_06545 [Vicingaceae bacterium]